MKKILYTKALPLDTFNWNRTSIGEILQDDWNIYPLICQPFIARSQIDNPAIGETVLDDVVLHDSVVPMGVNPDV